MKVSEAQADMNYAYNGGGTGALVSGLVWCIAGIAALQISSTASMLTLFIGGMFIFPLSMLLSKLLKRSGSHRKDNPLAALAIETTVILFVGLFLAFFLAQTQLNWFYPIMLLTIGVRYIMFQTLYGNKTYWILSTLLIASGVLCLLMNMPFFWGAFIGGIIELVFSIVLINQTKALTSQIETA